MLLEIPDEIAFLKQLYAPAGLDIGAETPLEVAFSIVSEIKAVVARREGGLLRLRKRAIHTPRRRLPYGCLSQRRCNARWR